MKKILVSALFVLASASASQAQISRVFVAVTGNDSNDCLQPAASCRTLNGAINKVDTGGEVIVIETGSYAGASITKSVKINVPSGAVAFSATSISINAPGAVVVIRGATLKALTVGSNNGVDIISAGTVLLENCVIDGWANGVNIASATKVDIKDTTMRSNTTGVNVANAGASVNADGVRSIRNGTAFNVTGGLTTIGRSLLAGNTVGALATGTGSVTISRSQISGQTNEGFKVNAGAFGWITDSIVAGNGTGLSNGGTLTSMGNNAVNGNTTDTTGTITAVSLQ